ncbi:membrane protein [Thiohalobacter sp. COW1]|uniref:MgtC/SapB family protein n=1 Tax=Thiohalobacter sp. COW1 TaxID=2795687 RepID=UPI001916B34B|nr:MgtC/SapB family protein [Thiohalobacter sp. COW1]BCO30669.1 membrane protein [Thiohalobacter sp. COW1]
MAEIHTLLNLLLALALGLLIGAERGWERRTAEEGTRLAGIRTFGLIGLLGALWALLANELGEVLLGFAFVAFTGLLIISHSRQVRADRDYGITTLVAALLTFVIGALAMRGQQAAAASAAVVTAFLLSLKPLLHAWIRRIEEPELLATLKLLLISVVLLPVLPNRGYGPWSALNPYELWWLVVLIAGISFFGYIAMRIFGAGKGTLLTGFLGGITSSTATTLHFSRLQGKGLPPPMLAAGILIASATMFPRMLLEIVILNRSLAAPMLVPLLVMLAVALVGVFWLWRLAARKRDKPIETPLSNPFQLLPALKFALLLALVMLATEALHAWLGQRGLYIAAGISGVADVDAITLTIARMPGIEANSQAAVGAMTLAAVVNTLFKGVLAAVIGGAVLAKYVLPPMLAVGLAGGMTILLL